MDPIEVYALEEPPGSFTAALFLAGPSPRTPAMESWRPEAIRQLRTSGFEGVIFIPESRDGQWHGDRTAQIEWEERCLHLSDCILFWVPRDMTSMPALTTNIEFGRWEDSGRIVVGSPEHAVRNDYLLYYANKLDVPTASTLDDTVNLALVMVGDGALRVGGEREVPLLVWRTPSFQQWYRALVGAGNRLDHARLVWTFRVGPQRCFVLFWALHVDVYIDNEKRHKTNEVVLARPDISTIVMYQRNLRPDDSIVALVREFRTPVSNDAGFVFETAGGSSFKPGSNPMQLAADEAYEETGLVIDATRFRTHQVRQMVAPLSTHRAHLFSVELTDGEVALLRQQVGTPHGVLKDAERTYVEVMTLGQIRQSTNVDWSMLGMILQVLV